MTEQPQNGFGQMSTDGLAAIAAFAARLDEPTGEWRGGEPVGDGAVSMPWFENSPMLHAFIEAAYEHGLVVSFDWSDWVARSGNRLVFGRPEGLANLDLADIQRIATVIIRSDRFSEGALAAAFDDGRMPALIQRIVQIARAAS